VVSSNNHHNLGFGSTVPSAQQEPLGCVHAVSDLKLDLSRLLALQSTSDGLSCCGQEDYYLQQPFYQEPLPFRRASFNFL